MMERKIDESRCRATVYPKEQWGMFHGHQCTRKVQRDGRCNIHHPDAVKARNEASSQRYQEKRKKEPWFLLADARECIAALEVERAADCRAAFMVGWHFRHSSGPYMVERAEAEAERLWPSAGKAEGEAA